jgi:hypothetical protein
VELKRAGLSKGDNVTVQVAFLDGSDEVTVLEQYEYRTTTILFGKHRHIAGQTAFWRNEKSDSRWQLNVAAVAGWQYRYRNPGKNLWKRFMNSFQPGLGFHMANVSEGEEVIAYGVGLNFSLFDGMAAAGYGWNLSDDKKTYWLFGFNMLAVLHDIMKR